MSNFGSFQTSLEFVNHNVEGLHGQTKLIG